MTSFALQLVTVVAGPCNQPPPSVCVLNDMSGLYSDIGGAGSVAAAKLAVEDFNPAAHGMKVEVVWDDVTPEFTLPKFQPRKA